ncbi:hypothetical protein I3000191B1_00340 [Flavonifractor plautii]
MWPPVSPVKADAHIGPLRAGTSPAPTIPLYAPSPVGADAHRPAPGGDKPRPYTPLYAPLP